MEYRKLKESQDDKVNQLLGVTRLAINTTKDLVPIARAKGILGTIANIVVTAQVLWRNPRSRSDFKLHAVSDQEQV